MTKKEANQKLNQACQLIFDVESQFPMDEFPRLHGYRARVEVGNFQNLLRDYLTDNPQCDILTT